MLNSYFYTITYSIFLYISLKKVQCCSFISYYIAYVYQEYLWWNFTDVFLLCFPNQRLLKWFLCIRDLYMILYYTYLYFRERFSHGQEVTWVGCKTFHNECQICLDRTACVCAHLWIWVCSRWCVGLAWVCVDEQHSYPSKSPKRRPLPQGEKKVPCVAFSDTCSCSSAASSFWLIMSGS